MKFRYFITAVALLVLTAFTAVPALAATGADPATEYFNDAQIAISNGQYNLAVELFDKALAENTTLISQGDTLMFLYKDKAAALADIGRYDDALVTVNEGLLQFKNNAGMWNNKGYILYKMGRYNEAIDAYTQAVTIDPTYEKGWINKGDALMKTGRLDEAINAYNMVLALNPENSDALSRLETAQKESAAATLPVVMAFAIIIIVVAGATFWYIKVRKPADK
jgi:tetratricopeptide (TPR) repeat protein